MTLLLELREKLKQIYARYSTFLLPVFKFILAFAILKGINSSMGQMEALDNIFLLLILFPDLFDTSVEFDSILRNCFCDRAVLWRRD